MTQNTNDENFMEFLRNASQEASQDFDELIAKLGTAGITVTVAIAGFTDAKNWGWLVGSGFAFAVALAASVLSIRFSADGLRRVASGIPRSEAWQFTFRIGRVKVALVRTLNWIAAIALTVAYILLAVHVLDATILRKAR